MGVSEKIELLGKGLYENIPDVLTLKSIPTASELDYVGAEDFETTMLKNIFPKAIEDGEKMDFSKLLEIDFHWICRALRLLNYGPYYTTNMIVCPNCGAVHGDTRVDLRNIGVKELPEGFINSITISKDEFIDFNEDIVLHLPTIQEMLNARNDKLFQDQMGRTNIELARKCYMITSIGNRKNIPPVDVKYTIQNVLTPADYVIFKNVSDSLIDYGLRYGGYTRCPKCKSEEAAFAALVSDKFFRPTMGDLRAWRDDRADGKRSEANKDTTAVTTGLVRKNS